MADMERDLRDMMQRTADDVQHVPRPSRGLVRRARLRRARTTVLAGTAALALVIGGFAGARSLSSDEALPPANHRPNPVGPDASRESGGWLVYRDGSEIVGLDPLEPSTRVSLGPGKDLELVDGSADGSRLLLRKGRYEGDLYVWNADGSETRLTQGDLVTDGSFSPDGSMVAFSTDPGISVVEAKGGRPQLLAASDPSTSTWLGDPEWAPDGSRMLFTVDEEGEGQISMWSMNIGGTGRRELVDLGARGISVAWSPDGSQFLITSDDGLYAIAGDGSGRRFITENLRRADGYPIFHPTWSPDGSQIAFVEYSEYGLPPYDKYSIWVVNADGSERHKVIDLGPRNPSGLVWLPKGSPIASP
jgi:Tol biopolymer transport system component